MATNEQLVKDALQEFQTDNEYQAKTLIKGFIREIVQQQEVIAQATKKIVEIQEKLKQVEVKTVSLGL